MEEKIVSFIEEHGLLKKGDAVLVGVSGGPDSMVLLHLLHRMAPRWHLELRAAHLHHCLRGEEADRDRDFARARCRSRGIPFTSAKVDVAALARKGRLSIEDAARRARYAFLSRVARRRGIGTIALGHTADDQVETFLMRLIRGAGGRGLGAMAPLRREGDLRIVRPLLHAWKSEILTYAREHGVDYRRDRTNLDLSFLRNRVRHRLIGYLSSRYNPRIKEALLRSAEIVQREHAFVEAEAGRLFQRVAERRGGTIVVPVKAVLSAHHAVGAELIRRAVSETDPAASPSHADVRAVLQLCRRDRGSKVHRLPGGLIVAREYGALVLGVEGQRESGGYEFPLEDGLRLECAPFPVRFRVAVRARGRLPRPVGRRAGLADMWSGKGGKAWPLVERFSLDAIGDAPLTVRNRRAGDRYRPIGMGGEKKVKNIMIDEKLPKRLRGSVPLVACGNEILWLVGYRIAESCRVTPSTRSILEVRVEKAGSV